MLLTSLLNEFLKKPPRQAPDIIYHYTGANGLIGIVKDEKIWATKIEYLNDPLEDIYGRNLISELFENEASSTDDQEISSFLNSLASNVKNGIMDCATNHFVVSFTENPDDLVQWKMYGNDGFGYAIGFDSGHIGMSREFLLPVIYDKKDQLSLAKELISLIIDFIKNNNPTPSTLTTTYFNIVPVIKILISCMKQPEYSHEQEWRLIFKPNDDNLKENLCFREGRNQTVIPYIPINFIDGNGLLISPPITHITLGPQRSNENKSIQLLLTSQGYKNQVKIKESNIRYRG